MPELDLIAAGSLLGVRLGAVSFPVGKVELMNMQPMSLGEFLLAANPKLYKIWNELDISQPLDETYHKKLFEYFKHYLIVGGMPKAIQTYIKLKDNLAKAFTEVEDIQKDIIRTYYADMAKHAGKVNSMHLQRVFENIPEQLAKTEDQSTKRYKFQGVIPKKKQYSDLINVIDWLEATGLIHNVKILEHAALPLSAYSKYNIFKLYLFDIGLLKSLSKVKTAEILDYSLGQYKGYLVENFVLQEFVYSKAGDEKFYAWQGNAAEIEFLCDIDGKLVPIEVKSGSRTKAKSLASYINKYDPEYGIILSGANTEIKPKVRKYPLYLASKVLGSL
jgi:predicted AAA+ superfamily ATPase